MYVNARRITISSRPQLISSCSAPKRRKLGEGSAERASVSLASEHLRKNDRSKDQLSASDCVLRDIIDRVKQNKQADKDPDKLFAALAKLLKTAEAVSTTLR